MPPCSTTAQLLHKSHLVLTLKNGRFSEIAAGEEKATYSSSFILSKPYRESISPKSDSSDEFREDKWESEMKTGYSRVSMQEQDLTLQLDALTKDVRRFSRKSIWCAAG
jgi:hypothetical protein